MDIQIRRYNKELDEEALLQIVREEEDWDYTDPDKIDTFKQALGQSITFVAYANGELCGYSRSIFDFTFYVFVCDLLVSRKFRGHQIGCKLMECVKKEYPKYDVYVMSDVDEYYEKAGYKNEGSLFAVPGAPEGN